MYELGGGMDELEDSLHARLIDKLIFDPEWGTDVRENMLETEIEQLLREDHLILERTEREQLVRRLTDRVIGLGPLERYMRQDDVTEIMVNGPNSIWVQRKTEAEPRQVPDMFRDEEHIRHIINRIVGEVGRRIDETSPLVDARLKDGSRVHAAVPPVSLNGPVLTIRRFSRQPFSLETLKESRTLHPTMAKFLAYCVVGRLSMLVSGGTNAGKTTTLNALSSRIPQNERIVTIEDTAELQLSQPNLVSLETRPANIEGRGEITIRELVRNALRMRPDRIIVGECRGPEALDMLQAMNTGHPGSLTSIHANSIQDAMTRLETMVLIASSGLPLPAVRDQIRGALRIVVQQSLFPDGVRRVTGIGEVLRSGNGHEMSDHDAPVDVRDIYRFERMPTADPMEVQGRWICKGEPTCVQDLRDNNVMLPPGLFPSGPLQ